MGFLGDFRELFVGAIHYIAGGIRDVITESLDIVTEGVINIATDIRETFEFKPKAKPTPTIMRKKPDKDWLRAELRKQWLAIPKDGRQEIPGVEYEGELYFETEE